MTLKTANAKNSKIGMCKVAVVKTHLSTPPTRIRVFQGVRLVIIALVCCDYERNRSYKSFYTFALSFCLRCSNVLIAVFGDRLCAQNMQFYLVRKERRVTPTLHTRMCATCLPSLIESSSARCTCYCTPSMSWRRFLELNSSFICNSIRINAHASTLFSHRLFALF